MGLCGWVDACVRMHRWCWEYLFIIMYRSKIVTDSCSIYPWWFYAMRIEPIFPHFYCTYRKFESNLLWRICFYASFLHYAGARPNNKKKRSLLVENVIWHLNDCHSGNDFSFRLFEWTVTCGNQRDFNWFKMKFWLWNQWNNGSITEWTLLFFCTIVVFGMLIAYKTNNTVYRWLTAEELLNFVLKSHIVN